MNISRRTIISAGLVAGAMIVVAIILYLVTSAKALTLREPFATNFNFAQQTNDHTIRFLGGGSFVSYDLSTRRSAPLSTAFALPNIISDVRWSDTGALVRASGYTETDQMYGTLLLKALDPNMYYWWSVNFKTGAISLIGNPAVGADVRDAAWQDSSGYIYTEKDPVQGDLSIVRADIAGNPTKTIGRLPDGAIVTAATKTNVFYTPDSEDIKELQNLDLVSRKSSQAIDRVYQILATGPDGSTLAITEGKEAFTTESTIGKLTLYNAASKKHKTLAEDFRGTAFWSAETGKWVASGQDGKGNLIAFTGNAGKISSFSLGTAKSNLDALHSIAIGQDSHGLLLTDQSGQVLYASTKSVPNLPKLPPYHEIAGSHYDKGFEMTFSQGTEEYLITITQNPYRLNVEAALAHLKSAGFDPYQLKLKWYAAGGVDTGFRPPNIQPIVPLTPTITTSEDEGE